ncbi:hypothetical protein L249_0838 [Ophiocordyceps polyrhachis-furcata BCC 54312]|uniref:DASH complex subunit SPC19 n=1 Tax=Ophiocordyceps polyrhachis-furcata BCC 54312 TaxID=1330021 RepID=A0A367LDP4_9HYPO|nr:hypothetical protein L249_0838 [Ophiocordyceps polyrhachis-furcata BCC 54312]
MASAASSSHADCVSSLRSSLRFLESSVQTLEAGVSDFPRLVRVLKTVRHYELVSQPTLAAAEASLRDEIGPYVALLLSRADAQIERQDRRIETLKARHDLQQGRLVRPAAGDEKEDDVAAHHHHHHQQPRSCSSGNSLSRKLLAPEDRLRARALRQRKEALRYGVERLELEVLQKQRELKRRLES